MESFIGVKLVKAESAGAPRIMGKYEKGDPGYTVEYESGYTSWCPREVFEKANLPIQGTANKIHPGDVMAMIRHCGVSSLGGEDGAAKVTVVVCTLINGFTLTESSSCVDPANYDEQVGFETCMKKIEDKIWFLLGFLLQSAVYGFDGRKL